MPRTKTPPSCKAHTDDDGRAWPGCGAIGAWAWRGADKRHAKWFFVDARRRDGRTMTTDELLQKHQYDPDVHVQHVCPEPTAAPVEQVAASGISPRVYLVGQALAGLMARATPEDDPALVARMAVLAADAAMAELEGA